MCCRLLLIDILYFAHIERTERNSCITDPIPQRHVHTQSLEFPKFSTALRQEPETVHGMEDLSSEINPEYSLEGLMLKLQYCGHLM